MYDAIVAWVEAMLPAGRYVTQEGQWTETAVDAGKRFVVIQVDAGSAINVTDRRKNVRVILLGPRNNRGDVPQVLADIESLLQAALQYAAPCGAAHTRVMGEPTRPAYTTEDRAFTSLDLQVIF